MSTKKLITFRKFDVVEMLDSPEAIAEYLTVAIEEAAGDQRAVMRAIDTALRAQDRNMSQLARDTGITRSGLYDVLTGTQNPSLSTLMRLLQCVGLNLAVTPAK